MGDIFWTIAQIAIAALVAWGAFLCFGRQDRRSGGDRRGAGRGGRRPNDYYAKAPAQATVAVTEASSPVEQTQKAA